MALPWSRGLPWAPAFSFVASREIKPPATAGPEQPHGLQEATAPEQRASDGQCTAAAGEPPRPP